MSLILYLTRMLVIFAGLFAGFTFMILIYVFWKAIQEMGKKATYVEQGHSCKHYIEGESLK